MRLDQMIAKRGLATSRARAKDSVLRGHVTVDGARAVRPGMAVTESSRLEIADPAGQYVSRAALKLVAGLDQFGFDPGGRTALDIGASTGGFTQVLLERGAEFVFAVDVGHDQLDRTLAGDERVRSIERVNARRLNGALIDRPVQALVSDVSFISQKVALPPALALCAPGAFAVILIKPQFEVGRNGLGKGGIVRDPGLAEHAAAEVSDWMANQAEWGVEGLMPSPISGSDGNAEFLLGARKQQDKRRR